MSMSKCGTRASARGVLLACSLLLMASTVRTSTREPIVAALADLPAVEAFYHREFKARGWTEEGNAPLLAARVS